MIIQAIHHGRCYARRWGPRAGDGALSKLELVAAMQNNSKASSYLFPAVNTQNVLEDESSCWDLAGVSPPKGAVDQLL